MACVAPPLATLVASWISFCITRVMAPSRLDRPKKSAEAKTKPSVMSGATESMTATEASRLTEFCMMRFRLVVSDTLSTCTSLVSRLASSPEETASKKAVSCRSSEQNSRSCQGAGRACVSLAAGSAR